MCVKGGRDAFGSGVSARAYDRRARTRQKNTNLHAAQQRERKLADEEAGDVVGDDGERRAGGACLERAQLRRRQPRERAPAAERFLAEVVFFVFFFVGWSGGCV